MEQHTHRARSDGATRPNSASKNRSTNEPIARPPQNSPSPQDEPAPPEVYAPLSFRAPRSDRTLDQRLAAPIRGPVHMSPGDGPREFRGGRGRTGLVMHAPVCVSGRPISSPRRTESLAGLGGWFGSTGHSTNPGVRNRLRVSHPAISTRPSPTDLKNSQLLCRVWTIGRSLGWGVRTWFERWTSFSGVPFGDFEGPQVSGPVPLLRGGVDMSHSQTCRPPVAKTHPSSPGASRG